MEQLKKTEDQAFGIADKIARLPRLTLNERQQYDLEMLLGGGFAPLKGFLNKGDYESVIKDMRLTNGKLWPIPVTLDISKEKLQALGIHEGVNEEGHEIILADTFGNPLAYLKVESIYMPDKLKEAQGVYGTTDTLHPGVKYLLQETAEIYIGGKVILIRMPVHYDFPELRKTAKEVREELAKVKLKNGGKVIAFQTRNPIHRAHFHLIESLSKHVGAHAFVHPVVGPTKEGDIDYKTRVRSYKALHEAHIPHATLAVLPLAMRMGGPREALWHALIRKNYGATHFIVGRDHAGPGKDSTGKPFYGPYDAQKLALSYQTELGITIVPSEELVYVKELQQYQPVSVVDPAHTVLSISGTKFRELLRSGGEVPAWFSFPEVIRALSAVPQASKEKGKVIFFTGLSGAGKSTVAGHVKRHIEEKAGQAVTYLDGDVVRDTLSKGLGFSREDRIENVRRIGFVAAEAARHGGTVLISAIAPYKEAREKVRAQVEKAGGTFYEIYVRANLDTLKRRDIKGLYKKAELGLIKGFTGIDDAYEEPDRPHLIIETDAEDQHTSARKVLQLIAA